jgi:hypothetical protein
MVPHIGSSMAGKSYGLYHGNAKVYINYTSAILKLIRHRYCKKFEKVDYFMFLKTCDQSNI